MGNTKCNGSREKVDNSLYPVMLFSVSKIGMKESKKHLTFLALYLEDMVLNYQEFKTEQSMYFPSTAPSNICGKHNREEKPKFLPGSAVMVTHTF